MPDGIARPREYIIYRVIKQLKALTKIPVPSDNDFVLFVEMSVYSPTQPIHVGGMTDQRVGVVPTLARRTPIMVPIQMSCFAEILYGEGST